MPNGLTMRHKVSRRIRIFTDQYPWLGPAIYILSLHYFIAQVLAAHAWQTPYSWSQDAISDLGNTACGVFNGRDVCSPAHGLMNASFMLLGMLMLGGSLLLYQEFRERRGTLLGFSLMALAGIGTVLVGLYPENTVAHLHILGASLPFVAGNLSLLVLGLRLYGIPYWLRVYTLTSGVVALTALLFFVTHYYGNFGLGGMERLVAYPQTVWLIIFGIYIGQDRYFNPHSRRRGD